MRTASCMPRSRRSFTFVVNDVECAGHAGAVRAAAWPPHSRIRPHDVDVGAPVKLRIEDFHYADLYDTRRLGDLALAFDRTVERSDAALFGRFDGYRFAMQSGIAPGGLTQPEEPALLIEVSRHLAAFLAQLFHTDQTPVKSRTAHDN